MLNKSTTVLVLVLISVLAPLSLNAQNESKPKPICTKTINVPCTTSTEPSKPVRHHRAIEKTPQPVQPVAPAPTQPQVIPVPEPSKHDEYMEKIFANIALSQAQTTQNLTETAKANAKAYELSAQTAAGELEVDKAAQATNQFRANIERDLADANIDLMGTQRNVMKWGVVEGFFGDATRMAGMIWQPGVNVNLSNMGGNVGPVSATGGSTGPIDVKATGGQGGTASSSSTSSAQTGPVSVKTGPVSVSNPVNVNNPISISNSNQQQQGQQQGQQQDQSQSGTQTQNGGGGGNGGGKPPCPPPGQGGGGDKKGGHDDGISGNGGHNNGHGNDPGHTDNGNHGGGH